MAFDKIGSNGKIMDQFGIDTGKRIDDRGNITDRFGMVTGKSINSSGQIIDGFNGLGRMAFKSVDPNTGNVVDNLNGNMPTTIEDTLLPMQPCLPLNAPNPRIPRLPDGMPYIPRRPAGLFLQAAQPPKPLSPDELSDEDWVIFVGEMRNDLTMSVCTHTQEKHGLFTEKWGCGRKVEADDYCEQESTTMETCVAYIADHFHLSEDDAIDIFKALRQGGLLHTYKCGAVFL